jgi:hypothetical protein
MRPNQYVKVGDRQWAEYEAADGFMRKLLHVRIFYGSMPMVDAETVRCAVYGDRPPAGFRYVLHPLRRGRIADGHAVTERYYRNEVPSYIHRSERSKARTRSTLDRMTLDGMLPAIDLPIV